MSAIVGGRKITDLTAKTSPSDSDLMAVGDSGTAALRKVTLSNLANWIKSKVDAFKFTSNVGSEKTITQMINALSQGAGSVQYTFGGGYLTSSNKDIAFTVPTNRVINGVSISSVTLDGCQIRQDGSYLINGTTDISITATTSGLTGISVTLNKMQNGEKVSFGGTNNDSVGVWVRFTVVWE